MKSNILSEQSCICLKSNNVWDEEFLVHLLMLYKWKLWRVITNQSNSNLFEWSYKQDANETRTLKITLIHSSKMLRAKHILKIKEVLLSSN